jgi:hypothetical protein
VCHVSSPYLFSDAVVLDVNFKLSGRSRVCVLTGHLSTTCVRYPGGVSKGVLLRFWFLPSDDDVL